MKQCRRNSSGLTSNMFLKHYTFTVPTQSLLSDRLQIKCGNMRQMRNTYTHSRIHTVLVVNLQTVGQLGYIGVDWRIILN
jgi:hypothetical protein